MLLSLKRIFKAGWSSFCRNGLLSTATTTIMVITLFVISLLVVINMIGQVAIAALQEKVDISVYFRTDTPSSQILDLKSDLERFDEIQNVEYISRGQALTNFKTRHKDNPIILQSLEELEDNPLEATLNIKARQASFYPAIVGYLEGPKFASMVSKINYEENKEVIDKLSRITGTFSNIVLILSVVFAIIAVLVTFNTIRLTMYSYRQEVEIKRLVGASNWYIRWPFIIEGILYGLFGAIACLAILYLVILLASANLNKFLPQANIEDWFISNLLLIIILELAVGIGLGVISSLIAIRRYLKV